MITEDQLEQFFLKWFQTIVTFFPLTKLPQVEGAL